MDKNYHKKIRRLNELNSRIKVQEGMRAKCLDEIAMGSDVESSPRVKIQFAEYYDGKFENPYGDLEFCFDNTAPEYMALRQELEKLKDKLISRKIERAKRLQEELDSLQKEKQELMREIEAVEDEELKETLAFRELKHKYPFDVIEFYDCPITGGRQERLLMCSLPNNGTVLVYDKENEKETKVDFPSQHYRFIF